MSGSREDIETATLLSAILKRRSRRFAPGLRLSAPLAFASQRPATPLTREQEAVLAFAANGVTGYATAELPYQDEDGGPFGGGNVILHFVARTVASGDNAHPLSLVVINDDGAWLLRRPQDYAQDEMPDLIAAARRHEFVALYERSRLRLSHGRVDVPRVPPYTPPFNHWSVNPTGSTVFLPIHELTALYINILLSAFSEDYGAFVIDERTLRPAGLAKFARSKGGHLDDDPRHGKVASITFAERWLCEFAAWESGAMMQNLALVGAALDLGGFPFFAAHAWGWFEALGFRMAHPTATRTLGANVVQRWAARLLARDVDVPTAVGLERDGQPLLKPFAPPYYRTMTEAVRAFVDYKMRPGAGTLKGGSATPWRDGAAVQAAIPTYSDKAVAATIAYCEYVYQTYGRFPACGGPFRTLLAYQAHPLDPDFYPTYYKDPI